jgi:hypothetical protein
VAREVKEPFWLAVDVLTLHDRDGVLSPVLEDGEAPTYIYIVIYLKRGGS